MKRTLFECWNLPVNAPAHELIEQLQERAAFGRLEDSWDEAEYQQTLHLLEDEEKLRFHRFFSYQNLP